MKNSNSILLIDPSFGPAEAMQCSLLVKIGRDSCSYAITDPRAGKVVAIFDQQECADAISAFTDRMNNDPNLKLPFATTKIAVYTENAIQIPNVFFDRNELLAHTQFFVEPTSPELHVAVQPHFAFTTLFNLQPAAAAISGSLGGKMLPFTSGLLAIAENLNEMTLLLDFTVNSFTAVYINDTQVVFQQCYEIEQVEEFNYYLLLMINQLQLNVDRISVQLTGIVHMGDDRYSCLQKYFNRIQFLSLNNLDQEVIDDLPLHYYSPLLALDRCE